MLGDYNPSNGVTTIERRKAATRHETAGKTIALVLDRLIENERRHVLVALFDLRNLRIVEVDVIGNDLDALVERLLRHVFQTSGAAIVDDDAIDAEIDGLLDQIALRFIVIAGLRDGEFLRERIAWRFTPAS